MQTMTTATTGKTAKTVCMFSAGQVDCACAACRAEAERIAKVRALPKADAFKGAVLTW